MKQKHVILTMILVFTCIFNLGMAKAPQTKNDLPDAIDFTLNDLNGNPVKLSSYYGKKIVVLNFFTTWCPACNEEIPHLKELYSTYKNADIEIIAVSLKESDSVVKNLVQSKGVTYTVLLDSKGEVGTKYGVRYIPSNFIINKQGKVVYKGLYTPLKTFKLEIGKLL